MQPAGLAAVKEEDEGEDIILEPEDPTMKVNGDTKISTVAVEDSDEACDACTI